MSSLTGPAASDVAGRPLSPAAPYPTGPDVLALQRAVNARRRARRQPTIPEDGTYGPVTHQAAQETVWYLGIGTRRSTSVPLSVYAQRLVRSPRRRTGRQRARARARRKLLRMTVVRPLATALGTQSQFAMVDAEGAPDRFGVAHHAAYDFMAPGGSAVRAPVSGVVVEARPSRGNTGQVFGGVVKVEADRDGRVWVFRHVEPRTTLGHRVAAGQLIARVTAWRDGPSHSHIELWKTLAGGYRYENMEDPLPLLRG